MDGLNEMEEKQPLQEKIVSANKKERIEYSVDEHWLTFSQQEIVIMFVTMHHVRALSSCAQYIRIRSQFTSNVQTNNNQHIIAANGLEQLHTMERKSCASVCS